MEERCQARCQQSYAYFQVRTSGSVSTHQCRICGIAILLMNVISVINVILRMLLSIELSDTISSNKLIPSLQLPDGPMARWKDADRQLWRRWRDPVVGSHKPS